MGVLLSRAHLGQRLYYIRNDIPGTLDQYLVPDPQVLFADNVFVEQRDGTYGYPTQRHRVDLGNRGDAAGTAHLELHTPQGAGSLPGLEFKGNGPAGMMSGHAHLIL